MPWFPLGWLDLLGFNWQIKQDTKNYTPPNLDVTLHEIVKNIFLIFKHLLFKKKMDNANLPYLVNWKK